MMKGGVRWDLAEPPTSPSSSCSVHATWGGWTLSAATGWMGMLWHAVGRGGSRHVGRGCRSRRPHVSSFPCALPVRTRPTHLLLPAAEGRIFCVAGAAVGGGRGPVSAPHSKRGYANAARLALGGGDAAGRGHPPSVEVVLAQQPLVPLAGDAPAGLLLDCLGIQLDVARLPRARGRHPAFPPGPPPTRGRRGPTSGLRTKNIALTVSWSPDVPPPSPRRPTTRAARREPLASSPLRACSKTQQRNSSRSMGPPPRGAARPEAEGDEPK
jgi:hypothetical protein